MTEGLSLLKTGLVSRKRQVIENLGKGISKIMRSYPRSGPSEVPQAVELSAEYDEMVA